MKNAISTAHLHSPTARNGLAVELPAGAVSKAIQPITFELRGARVFWVPLVPLNPRVDDLPYWEWPSNG